MERFMDDEMLTEHAKDPTQMWVKYEECMRDINTIKADAQATIAALQAELEQARNTINKQTDLGREDGERIEQLQARVKELEALNAEVNSKIDRQDELIDDLRSHSNRCTAELEAVQTALNALRDGYDDLESRHNDLQADLARVTAAFEDASKDRDDWITSWRVLQRHNERIEAKLGHLNTLIAALPLVEGEIRVDKRLNIWVTALTPQGGARVLGCFVDMAEAQAYAALLRERQRMQ